EASSAERHAVSCDTALKVYYQVKSSSETACRGSRRQTVTPAAGTAARASAVATVVGTRRFIARSPKGMNFPRSLAEQDRRRGHLAEPDRQHQRSRDGQDHALV